MLNVGKEVAALGRMAVKDLRTRYAEVFGDETKTGNKAWLVKRIAWRLQALAEGDLSERARRRAAELANDADLRVTPPKPKPVAQTVSRAVAPSTATHAFRSRAPSSPATTRARRCRSRCCRKASSSRARSTSPSPPSPRRSPAQHCNGFHFFRLGKEADR